MDVSNNREFQQITFNHSSDIRFQDFLNLYKKCTAKKYLFSVTGNTLASDNLSCFPKNLLERIQKLIMTNDDKMQYNSVSYSTILNENQKKYHQYHKIKLMNMNILQETKYYLLIKVE